MKFSVPGTWLVVLAIQVAVAGGGSSLGFAQSKSRVDLDDLMIKGELRGDDRFMILSRQKNELKNYIKFRTSYREEMLQELPAGKPRKH